MVRLKNLLNALYRHPCGVIFVLARMAAIEGVYKQQIGGLRC